MKKLKEIFMLIFFVLIITYSTNAETTYIKDGTVYGTKTINATTDICITNGNCLSTATGNSSWNQLVADTIYLLTSYTNVTYDTDLANYILSSWNNITYMNQDNAGNLTIDGYYSGQPIDGFLGSGTISSDEIYSKGGINVTKTAPLNVTYSSFVQKVSYCNGTTIYCNISGAEIDITASTHKQYYLDFDCTLKNELLSTYEARDLCPGGYFAVFDVFACSDIEEIHRSAIANIDYQKTRNAFFDMFHLQIKSGLIISPEVFPEITQTTGDYLYYRSVKTTATQNSTTNGIHYVHQNNSSWVHSNHTGVNLSHCNNGTDLVDCNDNDFRMYLFYTIGNSNGDDTTQIHQIAPLTTASTYNTIAQCTDAVATTSISVPDSHTYVGVKNYVYCGRRDDTAWQDDGWKYVGTTSSGGVVSGDLTSYLRRDGTTELIDNWNAGNYDISAKTFNGSWNGSVNYLTQSQIDNNTIVRSYNTSWITDNQNNLYNTSADIFDVVNNGSFVAEGTKLGNTTAEIRESFSGGQNISIDNGIISINISVGNDNTSWNQNIADTIYLLTSYTNVTYDTDLANYILSSWDNLTFDLELSNYVGNSTTTENITSKGFNITTDLEARFNTQYADISVTGDNTSWSQLIANALYADISVTGDNTSWSQLIANDLYINPSNTSWITENQNIDGLDIVNQTMLNATTIIRSNNISWVTENGGDNTSWSQLVANELYCSTSWDNLTYDGENGTAWNRTGETITLANPNDNITIGTTTSAGRFTILNVLDDNAISVNQDGNAGASTSTGGAVNIDNTGNIGAGMIIYSNLGATAIGHLLGVRSNNIAFDQSAFYVSYKGIANAVNIVNQGTGSSNGAINVGSENSGESTLKISGVETGRGTVKVSHTGNGTDGSASGVSIDLKGAGTASQGYYLDATGGGTTGDLMSLRNAGVEVFDVKANGRVTTNSTINATVDVCITNGNCLSTVTGNSSWNQLVANGLYCKTDWTNLTFDAELQNFSIVRSYNTSWITDNQNNLYNTSGDIFDVVNNGSFVAEGTKLGNTTAEILGAINNTEHHATKICYNDACTHYVNDTCHVFPSGGKICNGV